MSKIIIGSAKLGENGKVSGGAAGDQTGKEVATEKFYVAKKGWNVLRAKKNAHATRLGSAMEKYCADSKVGYDQSNRLAILSYTGKSKTECDCSSLVRRCIIDATSKDVGNFTTSNEKSVLVKSGLFDFVGKYISGMELYTGDILVTCTKGHTAIVTSGDIKSTPTTYKVGCTYTVNCSLNCREKANKDAKILKIYTSGTRVTIKDIKVDGADIWIKTNAGWCAALYEGKVRVK